MTRYTDTIRRTAGIIRLEATGEHDESDPYRHKWVTRLRIGELTAEGPNSREAVDNLAAELLALASCPEAVQALAMFRHRLASARSVAEAPPKPAAPFADGEAVEVLIMDAHGALGRGRARVSADDNHGAPTRSNPMLQHIWCPAEFLDTSHGGLLLAVWSERCGCLVVSPDRVRAVNRPSLADVG